MKQFKGCTRRCILFLLRQIKFAEEFYSYIFADKIERRGSVRVPQRDIGIVV